MTTRDKFTKLMESMSTDGIKQAIRQTWNSPEGMIFREIGFEIMDERHGEEFSDAAYAELYAECH